VFVLRTSLSHRPASSEAVWKTAPVCVSHPHAEDAAEEADFANVRGKFWELHDKLYENQERLGEALYLDLAEKLKLSTTAMRQALEEATFEAGVRADFKGGVRSGVNGTPTFFIMGHRHDSSFDFETLVSAIHQAMVTAKTA
jgi:protein-disulfide isomerase